eukprot:2337193-Amphidinium_carterae.1
MAQRYCLRVSEHVACVPRLESVEQMAGLILTMLASIRSWRRRIVSRRCIGASSAFAFISDRTS